jgi:ribosomal protein L11 methyltransferase
MSGNQNDWIEIVVPVTNAIADDVAAIITQDVSAARAGVELRSGELVLWATADESEHALAQTRGVVRRMAEAGLAVDPARVLARPAVPEVEWRDAWKRYFHAIRLTRQLVIVPSWEQHDNVDGGAQPEDIPILLDPGQAFGTGAHATTRLLLGELQQLRDRGVEVTRFFDCGTGSGILAIAATKLWPGCSGVAVDIDSLAVEACIENAERNGVGDRIAASDTPVQDIDERFDLVLANIQAGPLTALCDPIRATVAAGGCLLLSGLLHHQVDDVAARYAAPGDMSIDAIERSSFDPEWASARLTRHG